MTRATPVLRHRDFLRIDKNYEQAATVANLTYVSDSEPGITRVKKGAGFSYLFRRKRVDDADTLARIKKLAIPPAWTSVWICPYDDGHIQATGYDLRKRKQYRYHTRWSALQHETKFHRMIEFGKVLPKLRAQMEKDLARDGFPESKVMAMVIGLMERTLIRVGSDSYEKLYGSYGLTTLKNDHVNIRGDQLTFSFKGKKGVYHKVLLKSKKFARIVRQCKSIPGKELFQYLDGAGEPRKVDSGRVNAYLKSCLEMDFTTKDFRTWAGTLNMLEQLKAAPPCKNKTEVQRTITAAFGAVSQKLGNTVAVCKKYYVHPEIVRMYKDEELQKYLCGDNEQPEKRYGLRADEEVLMKILEVIEKLKVEIAVS